MRKTRISSPHVTEPPPKTWSNCIVVGNQVFIAGMTARSGDFHTVANADAYAQARAIFAKIKHLMEAAGGAIDDVVKLNVFLTDINDREAVWRARSEFFAGDYPVSTLLAIKALVHPEMRVEIEAVGFIGAASA